MENPRRRPGLRPVSPAISVSSNRPIPLGSVAPRKKQRWKGNLTGPRVSCSNRPIAATTACRGARDINRCSAKNQQENRKTAGFSPGGFRGPKKLPPAAQVSRHAAFLPGIPCAIDARHPLAVSRAVRHADARPGSSSLLSSAQTCLPDKRCRETIRAPRFTSRGPIPCRALRRRTVPYPMT